MGFQQEDSVLRFQISLPAEFGILAFVLKVMKAVA
tara:strand:+ start:374 stop:478 length:105 start_codon:yes stop_codon:yes gene_type:complete